LENADNEQLQSKDLNQMFALEDFSDEEEKAPDTPKFCSTDWSALSFAFSKESQKVKLAHQIFRAIDLKNMIGKEVTT